jgi:hypothetical protein
MNSYQENVKILHEFARPKVATCYTLDKIISTTALKLLDKLIYQPMLWRMTNGVCFEYFNVAYGSLDALIHDRGFTITIGGQVRRAFRLDEDTLVATILNRAHIRDNEHLKREDN